MEILECLSLGFKLFSFVLFHYYNLIEIHIIYFNDGKVNIIENNNSSFNSNNHLVFISSYLPKLKSALSPLHIPLTSHSIELL